MFCTSRLDSPKKRKKKRRTSETGGGGGGDGGLSRDDECEVWFHEDCVCWMPNVRLLGTKLYGLEEAIAGAGKANCSRYDARR